MEFGEIDKAVNFSEQKLFSDEFLGMYLELSLECKNLPNLDTLSLTDAACIVYLQNQRYFFLNYNNQRKIWVRIGCTEVIPDNLNPKFIKSISLSYMFEERQRVSFSIYNM